MSQQFEMGNKVLAKAAFDAGAKAMYSYPITPASEILETWVGMCEKDPSLKYLQTEDEMAAGFGVIGACLAGTPAFAATAGPGNVLMQDAFSMAEALRIPTVAMIMQRGGLSTSTVIYSQQEVRLTCFGGNGEGFRIVYSPGNLQELYDYTLKAFRVAWLYRFPTFILSDGYLGKMKSIFSPPTKKSPLDLMAKPILKKGVNLRNCYNLEEEIGQVVLRYAQEYQKVRPEIEEFEEENLANAEVVLLAHGIVAGAVKEAFKLLKKEGIKNVGLLRPITLRPFPVQKVRPLLNKAQKVLVFESALGQLAELFKIEHYLNKIPVLGVYKPAMGFTPLEIAQIVKERGQ